MADQPRKKARIEQTDDAPKRKWSDEEEAERALVLQAIVYLKAVLDTYEPGWQPEPDLWSSRTTDVGWRKDYMEKAKALCRQWTEIVRSRYRTTI